MVLVASSLSAGFSTVLDTSLFFLCARFGWLSTTWRVFVQDIDLAGGGVLHGLYRDATCGSFG